MADRMFNVGRGRIQQLVDDGETFKLLALKATGTDEDVTALDTVAAVLAEGSTTEADFTNYARKTLASLAATVDDTDDTATADAADITWTSAGGTTDNTLTDVVIYHDVDGTDANAVPLVLLDFERTTDGSNLELVFGSDGFWRSEEPA